MALNKIRRRHVDYTWPGFVDALSSLLMVIIFVLMIFVLSQFFLSQKMNGQDEALVKLKTNLIELSELLSIERNATTELTNSLTIFENKLNIIQSKLEQEEIKNANNNNKLKENEQIINLSKIKILDLENILNKKADLNFIEHQKGDVFETFADIEPMVKEFDYSPKTSIKNGLVKFVNWYKLNNN